MEIFSNLSFRTQKSPTIWARGTIISFPLHRGVFGDFLKDILHNEIIEGLREGVKTRELLGGSSQSQHRYKLKELPHRRSCFSYAIQNCWEAVLGIQATISLLFPPGDGAVVLQHTSKSTINLKFSNKLMLSPILA